MPDAKAAPDGLVADLKRARDARDDAEDAVADVGESRIRALRDALTELDRLLAQYEEDATGTGDFQSYLSFQDDLVAFVEELDDDLPEREAFESLLDLFKKRRLSDADFTEARNRLSDARDLVGRLDHLADTRKRYADARQAVEERADEHAAEVEHLERLRRLGNADLDAPVEDLRDPIEAYDEAVREAFEAFKSNASARCVLDLVATAESYPLVPFEPVPGDLREFVAGADDAGGEPIPQLLEYAEYSPSKLEHYVEEPRTLKRVVGGNRTYLDRLDADPLVVDWPPAPAAELQYRARELVAVVGRFADDSVLEWLHAVRAAARTNDYERLRTAAVADHELTDGEMERAASGVEDDLEAAREAEAALRDALSEY
ncbi:DUF7118 family protein [Halobacterium zhouii]|uniref:DUF7118 family protein n=1 Tax=Halobacterium zhouii TaxID=2902624 RepID=UPI001E4B0866|nr:hypothetical protein [Halobacterium zhouii]